MSALVADVFIKRFLDSI